MFAISVGNRINTESTEVKCYVDEKLISESDFSEVCHFNEDTLEVKCEVEFENDWSEGLYCLMRFKKEK